MYGEKDVERDLQFLLKGLQKLNAENDRWMFSHNSKSKRELQKKLQELKQGSMSVEEYFHEMELAMIRAGVKETAKATMDRFVNGLNRELACFAKTLTSLDIDISIQLIAKYEQNIKQQRCLENTPNTKEIESLIVGVPNDELEPAKEEGELNVEDQAEKCVEDPLNHEEKSENMSEIDFSEIMLERKVEHERGKDIESMEYFENKERKNESEELKEKKDEKNYERSEVKNDCKDIVSITNDLNHYLPCDFDVLQAFLDMIPKKPPDGFLSSRIIEPLSPLIGIETHYGSLKFVILYNLLPLRVPELHAFNFPCPMNFAVCKLNKRHASWLKFIKTFPYVIIYKTDEDSRTNPFEERGNDAIQIGSTYQVHKMKDVINSTWAGIRVADHNLGLKT